MAAKRSKSCAAPDRIENTRRRAQIALRVRGRRPDQEESFRKALLAPPRISGSISKRTCRECPSAGRRPAIDACVACCKRFVE
jgi:hypothetical protein